MRRFAVAPIHLSDVAAQAAPSGTIRRTFSLDLESGAQTFHFTLPPGWRSPYANGQFEYHSSHEEIILFDGTLHFGDWYDFAGPAYLNHPPFWVHPSDESTDTGVSMLVKYSGKTDFGFLAIPADWDRREFVAPGKPVSPSRGVSTVALESLPWEPVLYQDLTPTGFEARTLWIDEEDGWTTWLMRVPAGWRGKGMKRSMPGGDELYVVEGDLSLPMPDDTRLVSGSYYCVPDRFTDGGMRASSEAGCVAIRWTKTPNYLLLPPVRF